VETSERGSTLRRQRRRRGRARPAPDHGNDLGDVFGRARFAIGLQHIEAPHRAFERAVVAGDDVLPVDTLLAPGGDASVIDVGDVLNERDAHSEERQIAAQHVEKQEGAGVTEVRFRRRRQTAYVDADVPVLERRKRVRSSGSECYRGAGASRSFSCSIRASRASRASMRASSDAIVPAGSGFSAVGRVPGCTGFPSSRTTRAGMPTTVALGGTSLTTTEPAPIFEPWPIVIAPRDQRVGTDDHAVTHRRMALHAFAAGSAERNALVERYVLPEFRRLANDDSHSVVDEQAGADSRSRMDLDTGAPANDGCQKRGKMRRPAR